MKWKNEALRDKPEEEYEHCEVSHKRIYETRGEAERAAQTMLLKRKGHATVYECRHCHRFHLTQYSSEHSKAIRQASYERDKDPSLSGAKESTEGNMDLLLRMAALHMTERDINHWFEHLPLSLKVGIVETVEPFRKVNS